MYVCLCKAVTDNQIRDAVINGCASMKQLAQQLGVATQCGKCGMQAKDLLQETRSTLNTRYFEAA